MQDDPQLRPVVRLLPGRHRRLAAGHPWVYSNEIAMDAAAKALPPGSLVTLQDERGEALGLAMFNPHPLISARVLDRSATRRIDEAARRKTPGFEPALRFRVDREALAATGALGKTEEAVLDLAAAGFTVRRILDVIPEDDAQVSAALLALCERGILEPAG